MHDTLPLLARTDFPPIRRLSLDTLQVNLGYHCNQSCLHCHVNAGPNRTEVMDADTVALVLQVLRARRIGTLDLTGGAPELNPHFRDLVRGARALGVRVIDRCNLTILSEPGQEDLAEFLAAQGVEVTASLPCYSVDNVDRQRGEGVFERSIARAAPAQRAGLRPAGLGTGAEPGLQPAGRRAAAAAGRAGGRLPARAGPALRHPLQPPVRADQHADPALRQHARQQRQLRRLHGAAARRLPRREPGHGDVPQHRQRRLAGRPVRLRLQPDAGPARAAERQGAAHLRDLLEPRRPAPRPSAWPTTATAAPPARAAAAAARWPPTRPCKPPEHAGLEHRRAGAQRSRRHRGDAEGAGAAAHTRRRSHRRRRRQRRRHGTARSAAGRPGAGQPARPRAADECRRRRGRW